MIWAIIILSFTSIVITYRICEAIETKNSDTGKLIDFLESHKENIKIIKKEGEKENGKN